MNEKWYMEQPFRNLRGNPLSKDSLLKLRRFYTQQLALSQALLAAKPLGICRTTTSVGERSLDMFLEEDVNLISTTLADVDSKEMST